MNVSQPPGFSADQARAILCSHYEIDAPVEVSPLPSERDQNFRVGEAYVLKIANRAENRAMLEAENAALARAAGLAPALVSTRDGGWIAEADGHMIRLITLLPGRPMGERRYHSLELLESLGATLGRLSKSLADFDVAAAHREFHWDLARAGSVVDQYLPLVTDPAVRDCVTRLVGVYQEYVAPVLQTLRRSVVHNDANDFNVIVDGEQVTGIIDFGDMVFTHTVNDVAIAMAYASLGKPDPLAAMAHVLRGYQREFPLTDAEIQALFGLACMRLCVSACLAAKQQAERPDDAYLGISQQPIRATLPVLAGIHPRLGWYTLREACGLEPVPHAAVVRVWLAQNSFAPVIEGAPQWVDMSVGSPLVSGDPEGNRPGPLWQRLQAAGVTLGIGGYAEARSLYVAPAFAGANAFDETRSIHLGVDLTAAPGTRVHSYADGVVHGFEDANQALDYGPVVVLKHDAGGTPFYTLYGHLSRVSLAGLRIGQNISKGECFAEIGTPEENGGWWPHVHMQVILDMLDVPCNFNGCSLPSQQRVWLSLCPDPNLILGIPNVAPVAAATSDLAVRRRARIGGNLSISYSRNPIQAVRGWMQYLYDSDGRKYLDAYNNVPHVGHCHPRVVEAVSRQLAILNTNTRYLQHQLTDYAEALTATLPRELEVCYFVASGSEANELALRLARAYTGASDLLVMDAAYHGHTTTLIDISPYKHEGRGGRGAPDWVHKTPIPDVYRGRHKTGLPYALEVGEVIDAVRRLGRGFCGYIAETCPSVAGQILLPEGFLPEVYRLTRAAGGVCIADEVQTGFGRMGTHFWAFEMHGVVPDIVVLGKPIANGYPMGAVICRREIAEAFDNGMEFFSTFGGSTAALAAAHETLRVTLDENLQERALLVGGRLLEGLQTLDHPLVGDVRGSGLFAGVELVRDRVTLEPAASEASYIAQRMRERGVLLGTDGPAHNVIKIRGPMRFTESDVDALVAIFREILAEL